VRIIVESVESEPLRLVRTNSHLGPLTVTWEGELPQPGPYDVELEVPDALEWGRRAWPADDAPEPTDEQGVQRLHAVLREIDELGVATLELGPTTLLVDTEGEPPLGTVDHAVVLDVVSLQAYPYEL
jgi:hypothetical protein